MSISNRQKQILDLLNENTYMTVDRLSKSTFSSPSSIRRDLTKLQNMCFIKRIHGGAEILRGTNSPAPFDNRLMQNAAGKRLIAKKASEFLSDGQIVMLDGSSTAAFLVAHIAKFKDITLFTNNMLTAVNAINYGIKTYCIGGKSINNSVILSGEQSYKAANEIHSDILFFSSHSLDKNGIISDPTEEENYLRSIMKKNSSKSIFLCDSGKFNRKSVYTLTSLNDLYAAVFDKPYIGLTCKCKML